ncbi:MAG: CHAT domain-containing tetratricopeptide repeat protein [Chitinophagaceae bacterium]
MIIAAIDSAAVYKTKDWNKWTSIYTGFYDSMFSIQNPDSVLYKQPLLDSVIQYREYYSRSNELRNAYYNRACDLDDAGDYYRAKDDFETTLRLGALIGFRSFRQEFVTLNLLASIHNRLGDITQSILIRTRQITRCKEDGSNNELATPYVNLAILYNDIGKPDTAVTILQEALLLDSLTPWSKAKLYSTMGSVQIGLSQSAAEKYSRLALSLLSSIDDPDAPDFIAGTYETLAQVRMHQHHPEAEMFYQTAILKKIEYEGTQRTREIGKAYLSLAEFYKFNNDPQKEILTLQKSLHTVTDVDSIDIFSLPSKQNIYPENTIMEALDAKAHWMMRNSQSNESLKYLTQAVNCFDLAFEVENKLMQHFSYDESRLLQLQESRQRSERAIKCCYDLHQQTKNNSWIKKAWQFAEKSKSIVLLNSIRKNIAASGLLNDSLYRNAEHLQLKVTAKEKEMYELSNKHSDEDSLNINQLRREKDLLEQQLLDARIQLRHDNSAYRYLLETEDSLNLQLAEKNLLNNKTGLIEYFSGDSAAYAFTLLKDQQPTLYLLPRSINMQVDSFLDFFSNKRLITSNPLAWQRISHNLYLTLIHPLIKDDKINSLVIIPDGKLNVFPFDALLTAPAQSLNLKNLPYLVRKFETTLGYSVTALLKQPANNNKNGLAGFAPVEFGNKQLPALPFTADEIENICAKSTGGKFFVKNSATLANFREQAAQSSIIHIASHANGDLEGMRSAIQFADSTLYLNELYSLHIPASLVVLSTCESGIGKIEKGEGAMSLARGFYYAGAGNIINSLWKVNDRSTARLFNSFYDELPESSYAASLRSAKLAYLNEASDDQSSPFYWAGFVITGYSGQKNASYGYIWWITAGLIAIGVFWFVRRKRS